jgi:hypothetical protein
MECSNTNPSGPEEKAPEDLWINDIDFDVFDTQASHVNLSPFVRPLVRLDNVEEFTFIPSRQFTLDEMIDGIRKMDEYASQYDSDEQDEIDRAMANIDFHFGTRQGTSLVPSALLTNPNRKDNQQQLVSMTMDSIMFGSITTTLQDLQLASQSSITYVSSEDEHHGYYMDENAEVIRDPIDEHEDWSTCIEDAFIVGSDHEYDNMDFNNFYYHAYRTLANNLCDVVGGGNRFDDVRMYHVNAYKRIVTMEDGEEKTELLDDKWIPHHSNFRYQAEKIGRSIAMTKPTLGLAHHAQRSITSEEMKMGEEYFVTTHFKHTPYEDDEEDEYTVGSLDELLNEHALNDMRFTFYPLVSLQQWMDGVVIEPYFDDPYYDETYWDNLRRLRAAVITYRYHHFGASVGTSADM